MEKIKNQATSRATSITNKDIAYKTHEGLERAFAARQGMAKLSLEQAEGVGGGLALCPSVAGGILNDGLGWAIEDKIVFTTGQGIDEGHPGDALMRDM